MIRPDPSRPRTSASVAPAVEHARRAVLEYLERAGPAAPAEIPGRWPLTRHHVRMVVGALESDGLVAGDGHDGSHIRRVALTAAGRAAIRDGR